jgi:hypothetical protein
MRGLKNPKRTSIMSTEQHNEMVDAIIKARKLETTSGLFRYLVEEEFERLGLTKAK